jgi:hypothetical protein
MRQGSLLPIVSSQKVGKRGDEGAALQTTLALNIEKVLPI